MLAGLFFSRLIRAGSLEIVDAAGRRYVFSGALPGPAVAIRLHDRALNWKLLVNPRLYVGEAYMDGTLTVESGGGVYELLDLLVHNIALAEGIAVAPLLRGAGTFFRFLSQRNPARRARRNVAHHYDLSDALFDLFLDRDRQYSCAYFGPGVSGLEQAQEAKKNHLVAKLLLKPGQRVLEIGSGWGGLALHLARRAEVEVQGITLSTEQLKVANDRARQAGMADRVRFALQDYRAVEGRFERIVSVGMFEHVGAPHFLTFFDKLRQLLTEDGVAVVHAIGRKDRPGQTNPWLRKYIFPGGYSPALSEVMSAIEKSGLWVTDVEVLRLHYADTLREWRRRFTLRWAEAARLYDERFCRMWEFYLAGCESAFRRGGMMVFQIQLARDIEAVPVVRDYMVDGERQLAAPGASMAAE